MCTKKLNIQSIWLTIVFSVFFCGNFFFCFSVNYFFKTKVCNYSRVSHREMDTPRIVLVTKKHKNRVLHIVFGLTKLQPTNCCLECNNLIFANCFAQCVSALVYAVKRRIRMIPLRFCTQKSLRICANMHIRLSRSSKLVSIS